MIEDVNISFAKLVFNHLHNTELRRALAVILIDYQIPDEIFKELTGIRRKTAKQWKKKAKISGFEALKSKRVTDLSSSESESQIQGSQSRDFQVILENIQSCSNESNSIPSETCQSERENETIPENQDQDLVPDSALAVNKIYQELYESKFLMRFRNSLKENRVGKSLVQVAAVNTIHNLVDIEKTLLVS